MGKIPSIVRNVKYFAGHKARPQILVKEEKWGAACAAPRRVESFRCERNLHNANDKLKCVEQSVEQGVGHLENKLRCQLHVAPLDVSVWRHAFDGADETAANVLRSGSDVKVRMVKRVEELRA